MWFWLHRAQSQKWGQLSRTLDASNDAAYAANGLMLRQIAQQSMSSEHRQFSLSILNILNAMLEALLSGVVLYLLHRRILMNLFFMTAILQYCNLLMI